MDYRTYISEMCEFFEVFERNFYIWKRVGKEIDLFYFCYVYFELNLVRNNLWVECCREVNFGVNMWGFLLFV